MENTSKYYHLAWGGVGDNTTSMGQKHSVTKKKQENKKFLEIKNMTQKLEDETKEISQELEQKYQRNET